MDLRRYINMFIVLRQIHCNCTSIHRNRFLKISSQYNFPVTDIIQVLVVYEADVGYDLDTF
jgi:hypothetical protein